jgi:hypothetical protein
VKAWEIMAQRLREECIRRQAEMEDPTLTAITIVVKLDPETRQPARLLWRTEAERRLTR